MRTITTVLVGVTLLAGCPESEPQPEAGLDAAPEAGEGGLFLGRVGDRCEVDEDCLFTASTGRVVCLRWSWGFRDGYCTVRGVTGQADCEVADPESKYVALPCAPAVCMTRCEEVDGCREGYECAPSLEACWPRCEPGRACPLPPPTVCELDEECNDGDPCTTDGCVDGVCAHDRITAEPSRVARLATRGPAVDVDLSGRIRDNNLQLLVAEGEEGVEAIDLGNPASPAIAFRLETAGDAVSVARRSDYIVVAEEEAGVEVFPARGGAPVGGSLVEDGLGSAVGVSDENNFLYAFRNGVYGLNLATGAISGRVCDTRGRAAQGAYFPDDRIIVVADSLAGLSVCTWPEEGDPTELTRVDSDGRILSVARRESILVAAEGGAGVGIFEVTDPTSPTRRESTPPLAGEAVDVRMTGPSTFVVAASEGGIYAFALEDCYSPVLWYRWETEGPALGLDVVDGVLAVAQGEAGVELLDLGCRLPDSE